jgi:uncharacterized membrane protein
MGNDMPIAYRLRPPASAECRLDTPPDDARRAQSAHRRRAARARTRMVKRGTATQDPTMASPLAAASGAPRIAAIPAADRPTASRIAFAATMIGLGVIGLIHGDFALVWQRIPIEHLPGRTAIAYACALVELGGGLALLPAATMRDAARVLAVFLLLWLVLLKLPAVVVVPQMEATWLGFGEIAVMFAGTWTLLAQRPGDWERARLPFAVGEHGLRGARALFIAALPMIGLSHFFYPDQTAAFVPAWLPYPLFWAYLTGTGSLAASLGLLLGVWPRLAATLEAAMLGIITLLVWGPKLLVPDRTTGTGFVISIAIAGGAWIVADGYRDRGWLARRAAIAGT